MVCRRAGPHIGLKITVPSSVDRPCPPARNFQLREAACPACAHNVAVSFFDGGHQPLATLAWPQSRRAAQEMARLPLDFVRCVDCGHVFNLAFDYDRVPYSDRPNLMFNKGVRWADFIAELLDHLATLLPPRAVVVEIGYGDASFLSALAGKLAGGRFIGFDPHGVAGTRGNVELRAELFDPACHLQDLRPDIIISRHVLEHLMSPLSFLQRISFNATCLGLSPLAYLEVPCIDNVLETGRTVDFYYEHSSQFTTSSFTRMLARSCAEVLQIGHGYGREVIHGLVRLGAEQGAVAIAEQSCAFHQAAAAAVDTIAAQLAELHAAGRSVAIWGGTGKSAAFMARYGVDAERFPVVVDSDFAKVGTFVPKTGQEIRSRDWLVEHPPEVVIIPPQWRAADIVAEMAAIGLAPGLVLIEHNGRLVDFTGPDAPGRLPPGKPTSR